MVRIAHHVLVLTAVLAGLTFTATWLQAQADQPDNAGRTGAQQETAPSASTAEDLPPLPNITQLTLLVQSYMVALCQANVTANYTVLHAMASPSFQKDNPPEKLAEIFAQLRTDGVDLTPIILYTPILKREPAYNEEGLLHLVGYYETRPETVHFDLTLEPVGGLWRLFGISVGTRLHATGNVESTGPNASSGHAKRVPQAAPTTARGKR